VHDFTDLLRLNEGPDIGVRRYSVQTFQSHNAARQRWNQMTEGRSCSGSWRILNNAWPATGCEVQHCFIWS
ncbi:hypothetical protein ABTA70_20350, partial [Acinetobacter baumannii]